MCIHSVLSSERWIDHYGDVLVESSLGAKAHISFIQVRIYFVSGRLRSKYISIIE
jgi:hypothetical protein